MLTVVWQVEPQLLLETDWILYVLSLTGLRLEQVFDFRHRWVGTGAVIVTRGLARHGVSMREYLRRFAIAGHPVAVIHVGDEFSKSPVDFYDEAAFVYRQCERPGVSDRPHVHFLPVGYKNGLVAHLAPKPMAERRYRWSFAGFVGGRVSRRSMVRHARRLPGGFMELGTAFNDSARLPFDAYVKVLCDTQFCLAPGGNRLVESFRVYEAIKAGAVPIVEVLTRRKILGMIGRDLLSPHRMRTFGTWSLRYWREMAYWWRNRDLWTAVYGPDFPCPRVKHWRELPELLARLDPQACALEIQRFWAGYEQRLGAELRERVERQLRVAAQPAAPAAAAAVGAR